MLNLMNPLLLITQLNVMIKMNVPPISVCLAVDARMSMM